MNEQTALRRVQSFMKAGSYGKGSSRQRIAGVKLASGKSFELLSDDLWEVLDAAESKWEPCPECGAESDSNGWEGPGVDIVLSDSGEITPDQYVACCLSCGSDRLVLEGPFASIEAARIAWNEAYGIAAVRAELEIARACLNRIAMEVKTLKDNKGGTDVSRAALFVAHQLESILESEICNG